MFFTLPTKLITATADYWIAQQGTWTVGGLCRDTGEGRGEPLGKAGLVCGGSCTANNPDVTQQSNCQLPTELCRWNSERLCEAQLFLIKGTCQLSREQKLFSSISDSLRLAELSQMSQRLTGESKTRGVRNSLVKCSCLMKGALV